MLLRKSAQCKGVACAEIVPTLEFPRELMIFLRLQRLMCVQILEKVNLFPRRTPSLKMMVETKHCTSKITNYFISQIISLMG